MLADTGLHVPRPDARPSVFERQSSDPPGSRVVRRAHHGRSVSARLLSASPAGRRTGSTQRDASQPLGQRQRHRTNRPVSTRRRLFICLFNIIFTVIFYPR